MSLKYKKIQKEKKAIMDTLAQQERLVATEALRSVQEVQPVEKCLDKRQRY